MDIHGHRLRDLDSKNGTFVNGMRIRDIYLTNGATIQVGETSIEYRIDEGSVDLQISRQKQFGNMLGQSVAMREIFAMLARSPRARLRSWWRVRVGRARN